MRVGVFQPSAGGLTPDERLARLELALQGKQLDLVVCPELFMSGYDVGDLLANLAEPCGGAFCSKIQALAKHRGTAIVYGYPELVQGCFYNSAACIDSDGHIVANHRKLLLPPGFESRYFVPGNDLTVFQLGPVTYSLLICYDAEYPEAVRAVAEAGAQVVLVPTALTRRWRSVAFQMMPTRAFENGIWLLYANHAGSENNSDYLGASCIISPDGTDAARAGTDEELVSTDLDVLQVQAAQVRLPYVARARDLRQTINKALE